MSDVELRKALIVFTGIRNGKPGQWAIAFLAEDAKSSIGMPRIIKNIEALDKMIDKLHGSGSRARTDIYNWGHGSEWVYLSPEQCKFFGIK